VLFRKKDIYVNAHASYSIDFFRGMYNIDRRKKIKGKAEQNVAKPNKRLAAYPKNWSATAHNNRDNSKPRGFHSGRTTG
jgi:homoserine trans-succinylase